MAIALKLNYARTMLRREGFALSKTAKAFRGAILVNGAYVPSDLGEDEAGGGAFVDDPGLWQFPETGVAVLRPSCFRSDLMESATWLDYWLGISKWRYTAGDLKEIPQDHLASKPKVITTQRTTLATNLSGLATLPSGVSGLDITTRFSLCWVAETLDSLSPNEGFFFRIQPFGIVSDLASAFFGVYFGGRWYLQLAMNGTAALYENTGTHAAQHWVKRKRFEFSQGGLNVAEEFQLAVIPWGIDGLQFLFSQAAQGKPSEASSYKAAVETGYLYECKKNGFTPAWDSARKMHIKTPAANLAVAVRRDRYTCAFIAGKVRYKESGLRLAAEIMPQPQPDATPTVTPVGYFGQNASGEAGARALIAKGSAIEGGAYTNETGAAWTAARDTKIVASTWLRPSGSTSVGGAWVGMYSPEVWAFEYWVPASYHTPGTETDLSAVWVKLAWRLSTTPDAGYLEFMYRRNGDFQNLYKLDAGVDLEIDGVNVFEGSLMHSRPVIEGVVGRDQGGEPRFNVTITDDAEATDVWDDLNETSASHFLSLTKRSYGELIEKAFYVAGVPAAELEIDANLYSVEVDGWEQANDWKATSETSQVGDILRLLVSNYGYQGNHGPRELRIIRRGRKWKAYLSPAYDPAVVPTRVLYFATEALEAVSLHDQDDVTKWAAGYFKSFSPPEFTRRRPKWNQLRGYCSSGTGDAADQFAAFIACHPDALTDSDNWDFQGRVRNRTYGPNELGTASTRNELHRVLRRRYDTDCRSEIFLTVDAEWQPGNDVDQFVMPVMLAPEDGVNGATYSVRDPISLGAFIVEDIALEITLAQPSGSPVANALWGGGTDWNTRTAARQGRYTLRYVGETDSPDFAMFSTTLPDYGRV